MFAFDPRVEEVLRTAGWFPGRSVQTSQWVDPLVAVGYKPLRIAIGILENLGGLEIKPPLSESNVFYPSTIIFDPVYAASSEFDRIQKWEAEYGLALFPLGEYDPSYILLCSGGGEIFGAREQWFYFLGKSIEEALEVRILARRRPVRHEKP